MSATCRPEQPGPQDYEPLTSVLASAVVVADIANNDTAVFFLRFIDVVAKCLAHGFTVLLLPSCVDNIA